MIGKLDQRVAIQSYTVAKNASGEDVRTWSTVATVWAGVDYMLGDENYEADQKVATSPVSFKIRFRAMQENYRILFDSDYYDILSIEGNNRERYLEIKAKKQNNG